MKRYSLVRKMGRKRVAERGRNERRSRRRTRKRRRRVAKIRRKEAVAKEIVRCPEEIIEIVGKLLRERF